MAQTFGFLKLIVRKILMETWWQSILKKRMNLWKVALLNIGELNLVTSISILIPMAYFCWRKYVLFSGVWWIGGLRIANEWGWVTGNYQSSMIYDIFYRYLILKFQVKLWILLNGNMMNLPLKIDLLFLSLPTITFLGSVTPSDIQKCISYANQRNKY